MKFKKQNKIEVRVQKTRKELRKEQRQLKKAKKNTFFKKKLKSSVIPIIQNDVKETMMKEHKEINKGKVKETYTETDHLKKLHNDMQNRRVQQLEKANEEEDKEINKLEKQLKLNKHKRKSIPKSFASDGLDYLLELCEKDNLKQAMLIDQNMHESDSEFKDDFTVMTDTQKKTKVKEYENAMNYYTSEESRVDGDGNSNDEISLINESNYPKFNNETISNDNVIDFDGYSELEGSSSQTEHETTQDKGNRKKGSKRNLIIEESYSEVNVSDDSKKKLRCNKFVDESLKELESRSRRNKNLRRNVVTTTEEYKNKEQGMKMQKKKNKNGEDCAGISDDEIRSHLENSIEEKKDQTIEFWEDIYGRTRDKKGNIVQVQTSKYVPLHLPEGTTREIRKHKEVSPRLRKQMKGLLNRLTESNMRSISSQIEELYMSNSRNDMNETLMDLMMESLVAQVITPERLIMEHAMLVAILHANIGTEIGAHVLQSLVKKFIVLHQAEQQIENKELDNIVSILSHLYNFKVFNAFLMCNILDKLAESFKEKEVELILLILKNVGFTLRKDAPLALKELILRLQQKAGEALQLENNSRVKFMLEVVLAIKNNNISKIPNYDSTHIEHLKKLLKFLLHKGNNITELKISLEDLLRADERGRWWVVGSAWSGVVPGESGKHDDFSGPHKQKTSNQFNQQLLNLARKQRMNTDMRRNIFCILMTAEDFLDAFEKLLRLGLKNLQEKDIIYVILHCCLQEKEFNPYYCHLAQKLCDFDRKYQIIIQCALWDKLKELQNISSSQLTNLARFLVHLLTGKSLPLSVLKVIHFAEVDKTTVRFLRQVLLGLLLHDSEVVVQQVFQRVAISEKLEIFCEGIRLFIHHFLLHKLNTSLDNVELLKQRANMVDKILSAAESRVKF